MVDLLHCIKEVKALASALGGFSKLRAMVDALDSTTPPKEAPKPAPQERKKKPKKVQYRTSAETMAEIRRDILQVLRRRTKAQALRRGEICDVGGIGDSEGTVTLALRHLVDDGAIYTKGQRRAAVYWGVK